MTSVDRRLRVAVGALLVLLVASGCAGAAPAASPSAEPAATAAPSGDAPSAASASAVSGEGQTLVVWGPPEFSPEMKASLEAYAAKTGATLDVTNFPIPFEQNL